MAESDKAKGLDHDISTATGDPTSDPEFQKVVGYFLRTPAKAHKDEKPKPREKRAGAERAAKRVRPGKSKAS